MLLVPTLAASGLSQRPGLGSSAMPGRPLQRELVPARSAPVYPSYRLRLCALAAQMECALIRTVCCLLEHTAYFYRGINSF